MKARVEIARGARAVEARLCAQVAALHEEAARDPVLLARPLRLVVPSRSLRAHVQAELARRFGALAGVRVQTSTSLALEIVEGAGLSPPRGALLVPILVRRLAAAEPSLRAGLEGLRDGYGVVAEAVSDLLDAGFEPLHAEAGEDAAETLRGEESERTRAVLRVAAGVAGALDQAGLAHRSALFRSARDVLEVGLPEAVLPARAVIVHGFADATGVQAELLESLVRRCDARVLLDRPPDPALPGAAEGGLAFGERFAARLHGAAGEAETLEDPGPPPQVAVLHAPGVEAEVRAVAARIRAGIEAGTRPERIAIVARRLEPYRVPLRTHLSRLGIPFSGMGATGPAGPDRRRLVSLLGLLERRERTPTERWLDALERLPGDATPIPPGLRADLLLGLHTLGASRVGEVARLDVRTPEDGLRLPVRAGLALGEDGAPRARHRRLSSARLAAAVHAATALCDRFARWPGRAPIAAHLDRVTALAGDDLGWRHDAAGATALRDALEGSDLAAPPDFPLERAELPLFAERMLADAAQPPLGGEGGGVQVLDVMEARSRTFEQLFVVGLNRDVFPRSVTEDPLVSDPVRTALRAVLPDLPVKREGVDEERWLFAQLLSSAPAITLSCALSDDDGKARPVSPLLDRLRFAPHVAEPRNVPAVLASRSLEDDPGPRPAHEHAVLAGLYGGRSRFAAALGAALDERRRADRRAVSPVLAKARLAVLAELDPNRQRREELGPYYGFLGPAREPADPRSGELAITAVESLARCPWQAFVQRVLHVEPVPDPHAALPAAGDARLLGLLVHDVLDAIVARAAPDRPRQLAEALARQPFAVAWPEDAALRALVHERARALVRDEGIGLPGFARVLALQALGRVCVARLEGWPDGRDGVWALGTELEGHARIGERRVPFRADRVDRVDGGLRIVDYKTGRPFSEAKKPSTRARHLLSRVESGKLLQTVAYVRAARELGEAGVEGRYLYLRADEEGWPARTFDVRGGDTPFEAAFDATAGAVVSAWDRGTFVPRLAEAESEDEPWACERCEVKDACLRGDSGARRRLVDWCGRDRKPDEGTADERALLGVWPLGGSE